MKHAGVTHLHFKLACIIACLIVLGIIAGGLTVMEEIINHQPTSEYPFILNTPTIEYVRSSKLIVLVNGDINLLSEVSRTYGDDSTCISTSEEREGVRDARTACGAGRHIVSINTSFQNITHLQPYADLAHEYNYVISLTKEPLDILPVYIGWHLNEADSCMLGLVAHTHLEELLRTFPEFCSDFRNFSQSETIPEMLKFYQLASSNYHGMLHCTANYLGYSPTKESRDYFLNVKSRLSQFYETSIIGLVFTPRTFGARVKLSSDQLDLWGGDEDSARVNHPLRDEEDPSNSAVKDILTSSSEMADDSVLNSLCSALSNQSIKDESDARCGGSASTKNNGSTEMTQSPEEKKDSPRRFPHCEASLVCLSASDEPDFHPVTGRGRRAHMTLGVAPGVSAVTTGTDLLEVVHCEAEHAKWPTYEGNRGWLRDYGEGRWVLYLKKQIQVGTLFTGVYDFTSNGHI